MFVVMSACLWACLRDAVDGTRLASGSAFKLWFDQKPVIIPLSFILIVLEQLGA